MLPSFIIFLYDFLIWNFSYSITHTSKKEAYAIIHHISLSFLEGGGGNHLKTNETTRKFFPVDTSDKRVVGTASLSVSSPYHSLSALHVEILNSYCSQGKPQEIAIKGHLFLHILKNYGGINIEPG